MRLSFLTSIAFQVNSAISSGEKISPEDLKKAIKDGSFWELLNSRDILPMGGMENENADVREELLAKLKPIEIAFDGDERRKFGVVMSDGLGILMAYLLEAIQQFYCQK